MTELTCCHGTMLRMERPWALCGPKLLARLRGMVGETVEVVTLCMRYRGTLLAVHSHAVWIAIDDECMVAITETIVTAAHRPSSAAGAASLIHPAEQAS